MSSERSESGHLQRSLHSARPAIAGLTPVGMTSEKTLRAFSNDFCDKFPFYPERCSCLHDVWESPVVVTVIWQKGFLDAARYFVTRVARNDTF